MTVSQSAVATDVGQLGKDVAVGVPVIERWQKLATFLESVPEWVDSVVVADNGDPNADRRGIYDGSYPFEVDVLDLGYDVGIGRCRSAIADASDSAYLLVADNDMELPANVGVLVDVLDRDPDLGGVGGILDEHGSLRSGCCDFEEADWWRDGRALVQSVAPGKIGAVTWSTGHPVARFDKLANAMVVRRAALDDYAWDADLGCKEHLDFFVGHWHETDWEFGVCPEVVFRHHTGGSDRYWQQYRAKTADRQQRALDAFREKWGYDRIVLGDTRWFGTAHRPFGERLMNAFVRAAGPKYSVPAKDAAKRVLGG